jgi:signal transduction histidine kinase
VECMKQGAHDYILKDRLIRLPASVQQACRNRDIEREKESAEAELRRSQLQLIQAAKMESVGRLAAGVAHEVKNPLTTLLLGVEYLRQHLAATPGEIETVLQDMDTAVQRANRVVLGLLDFSMPGELESRPEDLNGIVAESLGLVKLELAKSRVQVQSALAADLPRLRLDSNKIEQVFVNLFLNAIAAMPAGGTLTVRTRMEPPSGPIRGALERARVVAEVEDTGKGIEAEHLPRVFDPFFTTRRSGGTGLGLAITRKIVEMHGGEVGLDNRAQGGVRVRLQLPVGDGDA